MSARLKLVAATPSTRMLARSTLVVMAATLASTILGFAREVVNARFYGAQWEMDAFLAAATIPTILFGVFNGALVSALVPVFSEYLAAGGEEEAWRLGSTIFNALLISMTVLGVVGYFLAPWYVPLIVGGFPRPELGVTIRMTRWLLPSIVATSLAGVVSAMLNARHRFSASAVQGIAINLCTIGVVFVLNRRIGIYALAAGTAIGLCAQLLVQIPSLLRARMYRFTLDLRHPGVARIGLLLGPIVLGSAAGQLALFFDRYFSSTLPNGYMSGINYATKLVGFPQQIFAAAIATVIFPLLASQFANENRRGLRRSVVMGLRMVNFITIPAVCGLVVLARPIVATLFERGAFGPSTTNLCAGLLPYAAGGLVAVAANIVLTRCCFACVETRVTVGISVFTVALNIVLSRLWLGPLGARGLLLANSVSQFLQAALLFALVWRLAHGLDWRALLRSGMRIAVASAAMTAALAWIQTLGFVPASTLVARTWYLVGVLAIGALVFFAAARLVGVEEITIARRMIVDKFERRIPSPPEFRDAPIA